MIIPTCFEPVYHTGIVKAIKNFDQSQNFVGNYFEEAGNHFICFSFRLKLCVKLCAIVNNFL